MVWSSTPALTIAGAALSLSAAPIAAQTMPPASAERGLRDLTTDRPDTTESPFTIDAGHLQLEMQVAGYRRARGDPGQSAEFATSNFRLGLSDRFEVNVVLHSFGLVAPGGGARRSSGVGALDLRAKFNLWGNDGGSSALALLPFISVPLDRSSGVGPADNEYGLLIPLDLALTDNLGLGLNTGVVVRRDEVDGDYGVSVPLTASFAYDWNARIGTYYELAVDVPIVGTPATSLNTGITWLARDNLQLDAGIGFGVTGDADRIAPFVGFSVRF